MKRKSLPSGVSSFLASVMAILLGMLVGLIILVASNPAQAGQGFYSNSFWWSVKLKEYGAGTVLCNTFDYDGFICGICQ